MLGKARRLACTAPAIAGVLAFVTLATAARLAAPAPGSAVRTLAEVGALDSAVLGQINAVRARHGLVRLRMNARLSAAAEQHSSAMARRGFFSHDSADGSPFWKRVGRYYGSSGYGFWSVGENLLWASPALDAARVVGGWLESPKHRRNLLAARWREIGISAVHTGAAPGSFHGLEVTILTADFGVRR